MGLLRRAQTLAAVRPRQDQFACQVLQVARHLPGHRGFFFASRTLYDRESNDTEFTVRIGARQDAAGKEMPGRNT